LTTKNELYHFTQGVFETHPADKKWHQRFLKYHSLKVIHNDAMEVKVFPWKKKKISTGILNDQRNTTRTNSMETNK